MTEPTRSPNAGLRYLGAGVSFAAIVGVMAWLGYLGDQRLETEPWLLAVGAMVGVTLATVDLLRTVNALERQQKDTDR